MRAVSRGLGVADDDRVTQFNADLLRVAHADTATMR
jgi:hypothetical protein